MAKNTVYTFKNLLGFDGKKRNDEKALQVLNEIGFNAMNDIGETPLIVASYLGRTAFVELILKHIADVDFKVEGSITDTALMLACPQRQLDCIKLLVEAGANLAQTDRYGNTPIAAVFTNVFSDPIPSAAYLYDKGAQITDRVIELGMAWNSERFAAFLKSINFAIDKKIIPTTEEKVLTINESENTFLDIEHLHHIENQKDYFKTAKVIWQKLVPKSGQATTVQGELLRAIEKLRDEAQRNGNVNFNKNCHGILIQYLRTNLTANNCFSIEKLKEINDDLDRLLQENNPYTEDDIYDRITNSIVDWFLLYPKPILHHKNAQLYC
jgi:hypothetical protein